MKQNLTHDLHGRPDFSVKPSREQSCTDCGKKPEQIIKRWEDDEPLRHYPGGEMLCHPCANGEQE